MGLASAILGPGHYDEVAVARAVLPKRGVMLDVGAHFGLAHRAFAEDGWDVFALEPDPRNRAELTARSNPRVVVDPRAVSETDGEELQLFTSEVSTGISSLAAFHESHTPTTTVETVRLDTFLASHGSPEVTFLKVDTEGFDLPVLRTFPWAEQRPAAVVCEFEDRKTVPLGYTYRDLGDFLTDRGYSVLMSEWHPIVEYGMKHRWREVVEYPATLQDEAGWGNFIAVDPSLRGRALAAARAAGKRLTVRSRVERLAGR